MPPVFQVIIHHGTITNFSSDYSLEPNNVNLTNSMIENVDAHGVRTVNELLFFGFAHNFTSTYQMLFARCNGQTPVIISLTNSEFDGPLGVLFASGNIETYISNINIRSTQHFPWTTSVTIGKIYNSIEVDPIIFNGKGATIYILNISLQLITICGIGNYELFGFYLNQLGIWCDVNTVNIGTNYVKDINIGTNYDKNDCIDAYNDTYKIAISLRMNPITPMTPVTIPNVVNNSNTSYTSTKFNNTTKQTHLHNVMEVQ